MTDTERPSSFTKTLFFGHIPESMVIPFPRVRPEEREQLKQLVERFRRFAADEIDPARIDREASLPPTVLAGLRELGLFGLAIPTAYEGMGLSMSGYARAMQEIAGIDSNVSVTLGAHLSIGCRGIVLFGTEEQKRRFLPQLARGERVAAFCLTEPEAGSDAASVKARARRDESGGFVLDGEKIWVTNGGIADLFTVFAQTEVERGGQRKERITAFLVERGMEGVEVGAEHDKLGLLGTSTTALRLRGVRVPAENVLGPVGGGFKVAMAVLNDGRLGRAAGSVGTARQVLTLALAHATARRQFGRPLAEFGMIKDKLGRMMVDTYAAESMVYLTTGLIDLGVADYSIESAACKVHASEMLWQVVNEAARIAAGVGYLKGHPYERLLRDAQANLIFEGTNEVLRCYIALTGMQGPGDRLAQLSDFIKFPLKGYGLAIDFMVDKFKTQVYGTGTLERVHPLLKREAVVFEDSVPELAKAVEKTLRKHGKVISEMQFVQRRVADITIDLYLMIACIARTTAALVDKGPAAEREARLCRAACGRAAQRIRRNIRAFDDNDDELIKLVAKDAVDSGQYGFDVALGG